MASNIAAKYFIKQETGFLVDEAGNKLQTMCVVMCWMTLFIIAADCDIDHFTRCKMENIYQADDWYFNFLEGR